MGCVALRGQVIPVLDLAPSLSLLDQAKTPGIIAVIRSEGRVVGVRADSVRRIVQSRDMQVQELLVTGSSVGNKILPRVALVGKEVIHLLDAEALFELPDLPHALEVQTKSRHLDRSSQFLLCNIGTWRYCVPVSHIEATLPETSVDSKVLVQGSCEGAVQRHGVQMALMNPSSYTGFSSTGASPQHSAGIVIKLDGDRCLTLRADRISDILHLQRDDISAMPKAVCRRPDLFQGVVFDPDGQPCFVLDLDRFIEDPDVQSLASVAHRISDLVVSKSDLGPKGKPGTAVFVRAGGLRAFPIHDVEEIIPRPALMPNEEPRHDGYMFSLAHRGALLPIFSMSCLAGKGEVTRGRRSGIVVVKEFGERIGLLVQDIVGIEPVTFIEDVPDIPGGPKSLLAMRSRASSDGLIAVWRLSISPLL